MQPVSPLDGQYPLACQLGIQANLVEIGAIQPIQINMHERQPPAAIFMDQGESRTGHFVGIEPQTVGEAADECRFARPEITG